MNGADLPAGLEQYNTQYPGLKEIIGWTFYDTNPYVSTTTTTLNFFTVASKPLDQSNMTVAGQLAAPNAFIVRAIRVTPRVVPDDLIPGALTDVAQIINTGILSFVIGYKTFGQWPIHMLCSGGGAFGATSATNGYPDARSIYTLARPLGIAPQINFIATLTWPTALTIINDPLDIEVALDGELIRPAQ